MYRPILPMAPYLDALSPVPWQGVEKIKVFRIAPGVVTPLPCIVVRVCAQGDHENSMCRPILPTTPHMDVLSPVPWRAGDEKIKVFGIAPGGVTPPPCTVVGECAQGEYQNSMCRIILPTAPYLDALSHMQWWARVEKIKCSELHLEVSRHLLVSWQESVQKENMEIPCV
jgi:hypothetical protein